MEFNPETTEFFLFDAASMYRVLTGRWLYPGLVYYVWFSVMHPATVADDTPLKALIEKIRNTPNGLSRAPRERYLEFLDDEEIRLSVSKWTEPC